MKFKEKKTFGVIRLMSIELDRLRLTVLRPNTQGCDLCWALLHSAQPTVLVYRNVCSSNLIN
jgi:hypothetical protein